MGKEHGILNNDVGTSEEKPRSKLRLRDICNKMNYSEIDSCVPFYFDNQAHKFNGSWWDTLIILSGEDLLYSILNDDINDLTKIVQQIYAWSNVTAHVICNHELYSLSSEYLNILYKEFKPIYLAIRGDRSILLDNLLDILCEPFAVLRYTINNEFFIHPYRYNYDND